MHSLIESISAWIPVDPRARLEQLRSRERGKSRPARLVVGEKLSPLDFYVYLKARFGPPNGIQMPLRNPSSDNLIHWHYTIGGGPAVLEIWQANLSMEIYLEGIETPTDADWDRLLLAIKGDFANYGQKMSVVRKELERWHLFINPYKRLHDVLERSRLDLIALDIDSVIVPRTPETPDDLKMLSETISKHQARFEEALRLGVTIRMLAPVLGEAFVNSLIFVLAKPEIKADSRLYQDVIRREVDVRIKSLHLHCNGFAKPVDATAERFKSFQTLMNGRNDFLHGNVDPTKLKYDTVYFDFRTVPIFETRATFGEMALSHKLIHVEPTVALSDIETVKQFIDLVLESLQPERRELVRRFMETTSPGWRPDTGTPGVLFPEHVIHSVLAMGPEKEDDDCGNAS